jgi:uncharacterized protein YyaL (SSP411 family)
LGYLVSLSDILPKRLVESAMATMQAALYNVHTIHSTRAMAFVIKGLYYANEVTNSEADRILLEQLANRMLQMYRHESDSEWNWFESYLTYANSLLPEAMLCAWLVTNNLEYKEVAKSSFDFLLSKTFVQNSIKVISNQSWLHNGQELKQVKQGGEQPIDVAYTILALGKFYDVFQDPSYLRKLKSSFDWFLGNNHLQQIMYNPVTGGCYDGLEEHNVNLNQGAESTVSYLMARLVVEKALQSMQTVKHDGELLTLALVG